MKKPLLILFILGICKISAAQTYLPLTGGVLTGELTGTSANFTSLNIGVTPPSWGVFSNMLNMVGGSIGGTSTTDFRLMSNLYYDGGAYRLRDNGASSHLLLGGGELYYYNSMSGNAGDAVNNNMRFSIKSSGNVGIGTNAPSASLHVKGIADDNIIILDDFNSSQKWALNLDNNDFGIRDYSNNLTRVTIDDLTGNVGIGTISPAEKLSVNGKIRAKEIKVEISNWPDYVFEPDYQLPDLRITEQFIKENGHLPEIPSAKEAAVNGISLGEMNAKLLQKIEEMMLYLIELSKENKEQGAKIKDQQEQINQLKFKP